jgi:hypothetical protein
MPSAALVNERGATHDRRGAPACLVDYLERCCFFTTARQDEQMNGPPGLPAFAAGTGPDRF